MNASKIVVLDTNVVLDLFLFQDPRYAFLRDQLAKQQIQWQATAHMRNELERVLTYAHIIAKLAFYDKTAADILAQFDQHAQITPEPNAKAPYACKDTDDQPFVDLAASLANRLTGNQTATVYLISKDKALLCMRKRLANLSVCVSPSLES
jgi:putative PIN family toxin of toxin-antitoxin system